MNAEQPLTPFDVRDGDRLVRTILVPFSLDELESLRVLRDITETWLPEAIRGSSASRNLYSHLLVPWGSALATRDEAFTMMRKGLALIDETLEKESRDPEIAALASGLREIQVGFRKFIPEDSE